MTSEQKVEAVVALVRRLEAVAKDARELRLYPTLSLLDLSGVELAREVGSRVGAQRRSQVAIGELIEAWEIGGPFLCDVKVQGSRPATPEDLAAHEAESAS